MKDVYLEDFAYPCVAYVIRRIGVDLSVEQIMAMRGEQYKPDSVLEEGDIVVWSHKKDLEVSDATLTMGERGPITTKVRMGKHFGVYEGSGLVSDSTFDGVSYFPRIRLMPLSEHPAPSEILRMRLAVAESEVKG